jgi:HK97 family phage major capsid protein
MSNIKAIRQRKTELTKVARGLLDAAAKENRDMNEAESAKYDETVKALVGVEESLVREEKVLEFERSIGTVIDPNEEAAMRAGVQPQAKGFGSFGEFLIACVKAERSSGRLVDPRLIQATASGTSEAVPSDGGFLVQKDFSAELLKRTYETGQISQRVRRIPISSNANGVKINAIDEDSRADGSRWGGVLAYWANEADTATATKPKFRRVELNLQKLLGLCYATDELLQDSAALEAVIMQAFPEEFTFKTEDAFFNGTGAGQPLGILNSGALITQAHDSGDSGDTISTADVLNMWNRCWGRSRQNAVWYIDQSVEPKLFALVLGSGTAVQLLYTPPGGSVQMPNNGQYGLLLGRPVIPVEHCAQLGSPGDIVLADMSQYVVIDKGAPQAASSIHVRFLNDETTFRFVYRIDGQPAWKKPLTPKSGGPTLSPFVILDDR